MKSSTVPTAVLTLLIISSLGRYNSLAIKNSRIRISLEIRLQLFKITFDFKCMCAWTTQSLAHKSAISHRWSLNSLSL